MIRRDATPCSSGTRKEAGMEATRPSSQSIDYWRRKLGPALLGQGVRWVEVNCFTDEHLTPESHVKLIGAEGVPLGETDERLLNRLSGFLDGLMPRGWAEDAGGGGRLLLDVTTGRVLGHYRWNEYGIVRGNYPGVLCEEYPAWLQGDLARVATELSADQVVRLDPVDEELLDAVGKSDLLNAGDVERLTPCVRLWEEDLSPTLVLPLKRIIAYATAAGYIDPRRHDVTMGETFTFSHIDGISFAIGETLYALPAQPIVCDLGAPTEGLSMSSAEGRYRE
jgi:hypothetical protein